MGTSEVGMIGELLSLVTLPLAVMVLLIAGTLRLARGPWHEVPAEVADDTLVWLDHRGTVHRAPAGEIAPSDDLHVFYRGGRPEVPHEARVAHDERALLLVGVCLAGIGLVAAIASTVLALV